VRLHTVIAVKRRLLLPFSVLRFMPSSGTLATALRGEPCLDVFFGRWHGSPFVLLPLVPEEICMTAVRDPAELIEPLVDGLLARGLPYNRCYQAMLRGELKAERWGGRWYATSTELDRFAAVWVAPKKGRPRGSVKRR